MTAPRRPWSFSLRTLFVVVTAAGVLVAAAGPFVVEKYRDLQRARVRVVLPAFDFTTVGEPSPRLPPEYWPAAPTDRP